jgi:phage-related protein
MEIENWDANKSYKKFDIVKYKGQTFYSKKDFNDKPPIYTAINEVPNDTTWASENVFIFEPSYQTTVDVTPPNIQLKLDDGYKKSSPQGFNNTAKRLRFLFENRSDQESKAILNFLNEKGGEPFYVKLPFPYEKQFHFISLNWGHTFNYQDDNTIDITLEEVGSAEQPLFASTTISPNYSKCDFDWNKMIERHLTTDTANSLKPKEEGLYGDKLLVLSAYNPLAGVIEDFIVRCTLLNSEDEQWSQNGESISILDFVPPVDSGGFTYKPLNYAGLVFGFAKISLGSSGPKTASNAVARTYLLDGVNVSLWVEKYGNRSDFLKNYTIEDGFVTPQYFPNGFTVNPYSVDQSKINPATGQNSITWVDTILNRSGFGMGLMDALMYYWSVKNWNVSGVYNCDAGGSSLSTEKSGYKWVEKIRLQKDKEKRPYYVSFHKNAENLSLTDAQKVYSLLRPSNSLKTVEANGGCEQYQIDRTLRARFGGRPRGTPAVYDPTVPCPVLHSGEPVCPCYPINPFDDEYEQEDYAGLISYRMATQSFKIFSYSSKPALKEKVAMPFTFQLWPRFKLYFINLYIVEPVGTHPVIPGPYPLHIGYLTLKSIGGADTGIRIPLWEAFYLTLGRITGMDISLTPNDQYILKIPSWMGQACIKANTNHYALTNSAPFFQI